MCRILILCLILLTAWPQPLLWGTPQISVNQSMRILVLYSYNDNQPAQQIISAGLEKARKIAKLAPDDYFCEYLDISPQRIPEQRSLLRQLLLKKYAGQRFDLIITVFDSALNFLLDEGKELSPDSPCLALYAQERSDLERGGKRVIQSPLYFDLRGTLALALNLFPQTRKVLFISGESVLDRSFEDRARADFASWRDKLEVEYTNNRSLDELLERTAHLLPGTIVVYGRFSSDAAGRIYSPGNVAFRLARSSSVPVFCLATSQLDKGVVGGSMVDVEGLSTMLGRVLAFYDGKDPPTIEPASNFARPMVNWEQIKRWDISSSRLPPGTIIINRPQTLWDQNKKAVIATALVVLILVFLIIALVIQNRRRSIAQTTARLSEERYRSILSIAMDGFLLTDKEGRFLEANDAYCRMSGYSQDELRTMCIFDVEALEAKEQTAAHIETFFNQGPARFERRHRHKDGHHFDVEVSVTCRDSDGGQLVIFIRDITERTRAEQERRKLQSQLQQAQKMEYVGRLAGGVAHDFNNMLGVILGHLDMIMDEMDPAQPLFVELKEIRKAAERSADLTRQLLAFARKQVVSPMVLDLNETVEGMLRMIRRMIGENIDLVWRPGTSLRPVLMDAGQLDQILANLCVNARDAIDGVGKITIETGITTIDSDFCAEHLDCVPGHYVLLAVTDNGCGMDMEIQEKIFEPFFTTKGVGLGTGLGLSTVYGIVRQNNGFINVHSKPGKGTTFQVFLPCHPDKDVSTKQEEPPAESIQIRGDETILLVEDDVAILNMVTMMLERLGYTVLAASTPGEAIRVARKFDREINLLVTDVIMPEMNGRELSSSIISLFPGMKSLFMSGYTADVIAHHGVLEEDVNFIQKPFLTEALAGKIREILEQA